MSKLLAVMLILFVTPTAFAADEVTDRTNDYSNIALGSFNLRTLSFQMIMRPGETANSLYYIDEGDLRATVGFSYGNIWDNVPGKYLVDGEWGLFDLRLAYAATATLEFGFDIPFSTRNGGFMDSTIENFHSSFGLNNDGRKDAPHNETHVEVYHKGATLYSLSGSSTGINDVPLFAVWHITDGDETYPAIRLKPSVTIPVGDEQQLEGTGDPVYGLSLALAKHLGRSRHYLYLDFDFSYEDQQDLDHRFFYDESYGGSLTWEYQWSERTSLIAQYGVVSAIARDFDEWSEDAHHLNAGIKRRLSNGMIAEVSLQENLFRYNNSADFAMHAALTTLF